MGVSKQDWKDYQSNTWLGGGCKPALDELNDTIEELVKAIDTGDASEFLAHTQDDGKLMTAVQKMWQAVEQALDKIRSLKLEGNQRRFANKNAIATSDDAIGSVSVLENAVTIFMNGLVRGVRLEHDQVENDPSAMASMKSGDLEQRLRHEQAGIQSCYDGATQAVAALAAIDKIGIV